MFYLLIDGRIDRPFELYTEFATKNVIKTNFV